MCNDIKANLRHDLWFVPALMVGLAVVGLAVGDFDVGGKVEGFGPTIGAFDGETLGRLLGDFDGFSEGELDGD